MAPLRLNGDLGLVRQIAGATGVWTGAQGNLLFSLTWCRAFQQKAAKRTGEALTLGPNPSQLAVDSKIRINRASVMTLWAAVVAECLGFDRDTAMTLGQAVAGLSADTKGVSLGIIEPKPDLVR
jgi:hypothetical protein